MPCRVTRLSHHLCQSVLGDWPADRLGYVEMGSPTGRTSGHTASHLPCSGYEKGITYNGVLSSKINIKELWIIKKLSNGIEELI